MILIAFLSTSLSGVMQAANVVYGAVSGPVFGTFLLAMLVPRCDERGAVAGLLSSVVRGLGQSESLGLLLSHPKSNNLLIYGIGSD